MPTNEKVWQHRVQWYSHLLSVRISAMATLVAWEVSFPERQDQDRGRLLRSKHYFLLSQLGNRTRVVCMCVSLCWLTTSKLLPRLPTLMRYHPEQQAQRVFVCVNECEGWWGAVLVCSLLCGVLCGEVTPLSLPFLSLGYVSRKGGGPGSWNHHCWTSMWLQTEALLCEHRNRQTLEGTDKRNY